MDVFWLILLVAFVNGLLGLVGIFSLRIKEKLLKKLLIVLVAFSAGALLSGAFLHLMDESLEIIPASTAFAFLLAGFVVFFLVERFLHWHHCHDGKCNVHPFSYLILFGDAVHNLIDGVVIAASFLVSIPFGFVTAALIMAHELPQELGNFGVLVYGGFSKLKAIVYSFIAQLTGVVGAVIGYFLASSVEGILPYILPIAAGGFVYIAASDLIPELHKEPKLSRSMISFGFFVTGILFVWAIKFFFEH